MKEFVPGFKILRGGGGCVLRVIGLEADAYEGSFAELAPSSPGIA